jgi:hypothetical protein
VYAERVKDLARGKTYTLFRKNSQTSLVFFSRLIIIVGYNGTVCLLNWAVFYLDLLVRKREQRQNKREHPLLQLVLDYHLLYATL